MDIAMNMRRLLVIGLLGATSVQCSRHPKPSGAPDATVPVTLVPAVALAPSTPIVVADAGHRLGSYYPDPIVDIGGGVGQINVGTLEWPSATSSPLVTQVSTTAATATNLTLATQASTNANGTPGNLVVNIPNPTGTGNAGYTLFEGGGTVLGGIGPFNNNNAGGGALYLGVAPNSANYTVFNNASNTYFNVLSSGGTGNFRVNNGSPDIFSYDTSGWYLGSPGLSGGGNNVIGMAQVLTVPTSAPANGLIEWANTGSPGSLGLYSAGVQFHKGVTTPTISQDSTTAATGTNLVLSPQASTATNGTPGNLDFNFPAATGTGSDGYVRFRRNGTTLGQIGPLFTGANSYGFFAPNVTPAANTYGLSINADGSLVALNSSSQLTLRNNTNVQMLVSSCNVSLFGTPGCGGGVGTFGIINATTRPTSSPVGGGMLYATPVSTVSQLFWRDSSGTDWQITPTLSTPVTAANGGTGDTTLTAHAALVGEGTSAVGFAAPATAGQCLCSNGATLDPSFQAVSYSSLSGAPTLPTVAGGTGITVTGGPAYSVSLQTPVTVGNGGTGDSSGTAHSVVLWEGASAMGAAGPGTSGCPLVSNGSTSDPTYQCGPPSGSFGDATHIPQITINNGGLVAAIGTVAAGTPASISSTITHNTSAISLTSSYVTVATRVLTGSGTVDCFGSITWFPSMNQGASLTINYGVSEDSTTAPTTVHQLGYVASNSGGSPQGGTFSGTDPESYAASGSHTFRLLADVAASSGTISQDVVTGDLWCLTH